MFSIKVDVIFYDITSFYFEGNGFTRLAKFGYLRDGKGDKKQVLLGVVMADGLPIAPHVFAGKVLHRRLMWNGIKLTVSDVLEFSKSIKVLELEACGKRIKLLT